MALHAANLYGKSLLSATCCSESGPGTCACGAPTTRLFYQGKVFRHEIGKTFFPQEKYDSPAIYTYTSSYFQSMYVAKHIAVCKMSPPQYLGHQILFKSLQANVHSFHMNGLHRRVGNNKGLRDCNDESTWPWSQEPCLHLRHRTNA